ncbi:nodal modulator 1 [Pieris napi]|uniref:nodal modulator 1 n=1 Tax=Pieris napi TaxID=78633 RepID=UPI001FBAAF93|nr:nodal modulator 1 [Pieris napi]
MNSVTVLCILMLSANLCFANDILGCGGFVKSHVVLDVSNIEIGLYTKEGILVEKTECAPTNGYYFVPLYEKGDYVLKVHPPAGWSFEPSEVELSVDGETDQCSKGQDVNFSFNGFGITGKVITAGKESGPSGISVQLVNDKGEIRNTVTSSGGEFHFTPVIPGKYVLKASHSRWKLEPAQANVDVKEGNTVLPVGVLAVKGYDVTGSIISFGNPIPGVHVLLYSKEENPKFRVEGCKTALLQGVPDSPICYSITDQLGEFSFGLVPAGQYKLLAMSKSPGQASITYNIKPESVSFDVIHDSQYIKSAFEVTGFTVVGSVIAAKGGKSMPGARVSVNGQAVGTTDSAGKFTLTSMTPGVYTVTLQHEHCEWEPIEVVVTSSGVSGSVQAVVSRWRVCGSIAPAPTPPRTVTLRSTATTVLVSSDADGKWCTFLPTGTYTARVDVSEQEHRDGLQFYPEWLQVAVEGEAVSGVSFSQLRAQVTGRALCGDDCKGLRAALRALAPDGRYLGKPTHVPIEEDGSYSFSEVLPGSVEVSVEGSVVCWRDSAHNVAVVSAQAAVPDFVMSGLVLRVHSSHDIEVEYKSGDVQGVLSVPAGPSEQCLPRARSYELTPRGCHRVEPAQATVTFQRSQVPSVEFTARSHSATVRVISPKAAELTLRLETDAEAAIVKPAHTKTDAGHVYEHTLYLAQGEVVTVVPQSSDLLFTPSEERLVGSGRCEVALTVRAAPALTVSGRIDPPVAQVTVTLTSDDIKLTQVTKEDGVYSFGPLAADKRYSVSAEKDSYSFGEADAKGIIAAHKLAEIQVLLIDDADETPLEGALVSVSGGSYRRNVASGPSGRIAFGSLPAAQYYVKANMKEYRFTPPHHILTVIDQPQMQTSQLVFRGSRVAWSVSGRVVSLGGAGAGGVAIRAKATEASSRCLSQDATASDSGDFRIRGLVPSCVYVLELKESASPDLAGTKLVRAHPPIEVHGKDIENVRLIVMQPTQLTDASVLVHADFEHYRTLKLTLALDNTKQPIYSTKVDPSGYSASSNPGVMFVLPRLQADNKSYVVNVESSLSKGTHSYEEPAVYFFSDGKYKHFDIHFVAKVKSSEQELRASSFLLVPLLIALVAAYLHRDKILAKIKADYATKKLPRKKAQ